MFATFFDPINIIADRKTNTQITKDNTNFWQITGVQVKLDTTCK